MHLSTSIILLLSASVATLSNPHKRGRQAIPERPKPRHLKQRHTLQSRQSSSYLTNKTSKYAVDGSKIPNVNFDAGESYAGLLPNGPSGNSSLWFWFWPSSNPAASKEVTLWLNGGPGCSSLDGFLQENGPISWQSGTYAPIRNPYSWTNLTNMIWVDQPAGTGFSPGPPSVKNEIDVANQFNDFWKNFINTFELQGYKVYLTGESYAGQYIPYIADNMLSRNDSTYYNLKGKQTGEPEFSCRSSHML